MKIQNHVAIFHYHLERGGVTKVIDLSVRSISEHLSEIREIQLITGRSGNAEILAAELSGICARYGVEIKLKILPQIDYLSVEDFDKDQQRARIDEIKSAILAHHRGAFWWIHNYHIGKNPMFTQAVLEIADELPDQTICFHIHDFPECSRYLNLDSLNRVIDRPAYPVADNVRYAVINSRDYRLLVDAGIPERVVFLLANPVEIQNLDRVHSQQKQKKLVDSFGQEFPEFLPQKPFLLYPIRTIRRKNVLELGFLTRLLSDPVNLIVTLPGTSNSEKPYSDVVEGAFSEGLIHGLWGIGPHLDRVGLAFDDIVAMSDAICSSSVQEGFGYFFLDSVRWDLPLFARYLDILAGFDSAFGNHNFHFYHSVPVPLSVRKMKELRKRYLARVNGMTTTMPEEAVDTLQSQIMELTDGETIDFSYLPAAEQMHALRMVKSEAKYRNEAVFLNRESVEILSGFAHGSVAGKRSDSGGDAFASFSFSTFATTVRRIITSFEDRHKAAPTSRHAIQTVQGQLVRRFAGKEYIRLLYDE